jgi:regulator of sigma E protease
MFDFVINYIFMPIFVLALVIFVHEMGHFLMARYFKIKTPVFSVGFGREIWGKTDKNGTRWKLSIFPLGGYVTVASQDSDPLYQRTLIAFAGPLANFVLCIVLLFLLSVVYGAPKTPPVIVGLNIHAGAFEAGMLPLDKVLLIDGKTIPNTMESIKEIIYGAKSDKVDVLILRDGQEKTLSIQVRELKKTDDFGEAYKQKMLGVVFAGQNLKVSAINSVEGVNTEDNPSLARVEMLKHLDKNIVINFGEGNEREDFLVHINSSLNKGWLDENSKTFPTLVLWDSNKTEFASVPILESIKESFVTTYKACRATLGVLYQIIVGKKDSGDLGGVVAISTMTGETVENTEQSGLFFVIKLIALLSVNIGFLNLMPIPMLDGGHILLYAIEAILKRPPSLKFKGYVYGVSIMGLLFLMVMVTYRDILEKLAPH